MGAKHSCLINGIYIGDYHAHEAPLPARPLSQQQLTTRRQTLQLEYSNEHGDEVPRYRRQSSRLPGPQRQAVQIGVENNEHGGYRGEIAQPQPQRPRCPLLRLEDEDEDGNDGDVPRYARQSSRLQLPRRQQPSLEYEYDPDILRHARHARRRRPAQREDEIEAVLPPRYEDRLAEREDRFSRGSQDRGGETPPRYEDHVFDRRVDDDDDA